MLPIITQASSDFDHTSQATLDSDSVAPLLQLFGGVTKLKLCFYFVRPEFLSALAGHSDKRMPDKQLGKLTLYECRFPSHMGMLSEVLKFKSLQRLRIQLDVGVNVLDIRECGALLVQQQEQQQQQQLQRLTLDHCIVLGLDELLHLIPSLRELRLNGVVFPAGMHGLASPSVRVIEMEEINASFPLHWEFPRLVELKVKKGITFTDCYDVDTAAVLCNRPELVQQMASLALAMDRLPLKFNETLHINLKAHDGVASNFFAAAGVSLLESLMPLVAKLSFVREFMVQGCPMVHGTVEAICQLATGARVIRFLGWNYFEMRWTPFYPENGLLPLVTRIPELQLLELNMLNSATLPGDIIATLLSAVQARRLLHIEINMKTRFIDPSALAPKLHCLKSEWQRVLEALPEFRGASFSCNFLGNVYEV